MSDLDQDPHETVARKIYFTDMGGRCITYKELCDDDFGVRNGAERRAAAQDRMAHGRLS